MPPSNNNIILSIGNLLLMMSVREQMGISHGVVAIDPEAFLFAYPNKLYKGTGGVFPKCIPLQKVGDRVLALLIKC